MPKKRIAKKASTKRSTSSAKGTSNSDKLSKVTSQLEKLLAKPKTESRVTKLLLALTEEERRSLAPMCLKNLRAITKDVFIEQEPGRFSRNQLLEPAQAAAFCVATYSELKRHRRWLPDHEVILRVLKHRKPDWAPQFADLLLEGSFYWGWWKTVREMVRLKLCPKPDNPRYYTGMIGGLSGRFQRRVNVRKELEADPGLLKDEVWKLFEYEGEGENTLANVDRFQRTGWCATLVQLAAEKKIPRKRLLDSSLAALQLGFNHYRSRWFLSFYDALEPSVRELNSAIDTLCDLASSDTPNVATWAFEKLSGLYHDGHFRDPVKLAESLRPLLTSKSKGNAIATLKILVELLVSHPKKSTELSLQMVDGLGHEKVDVAKMTLSILMGHSDTRDAAFVGAVQRFRDLVAPSLRKKLDDWIGAADGNSVSKKKSSRTKKQPRLTAKSFNEFNQSHQRMARVSNLLSQQGDSAGHCCEVPAIEFDGTDIPRLDRSSALKPIVDFDELVEVCGRVIEDGNLVDDGERALAGIARMSLSKPDDFRDRTAPIAKRAANLLTKRRFGGLEGESISADLCAVICAWASEAPVRAKKCKDEYGHSYASISGILHEDLHCRLDIHPLAFLSHRSLKIAQRLLTEEQQLLSEPTHDGGWIDPEVLVSRIHERGKTTGKTEPDETDVILALLRLAPDRRTKALKSLDQKVGPKLRKTEWVEAIRHGLGAEKTKIGKHAGIWAASARARAPYEDDTKVTKAFPKLRQGAGKAPRFKFGCAIDIRHDQTERTILVVEHTEAPPKKVNLLQPTVAEISPSSPWDPGARPESIRWLASMWPLGRDLFFATGASNLYFNIDWWDASWQNRCYLEPLLDSDTPLREPGRLALLCALAAKEPGEYGLATDIVIRAIEDGRLGTDNLGGLFATHATTGAFNLTRLSKRCADICQISKLHACVIFRSWESGIASQADPKLRGMGDILELLLEVGTEHALGIGSETSREFLASCTGSGKSAKAAKQLLSLEDTDASTSLINEALEARKERLQRWQQRAS
ncbi:MAG: DUF6493 family protein [Planctomycetota bacterium]